MKTVEKLKSEKQQTNDIEYSASGVFTDDYYKIIDLPELREAIMEMTIVCDSNVSSETVRHKFDICEKRMREFVINEVSRPDVVFCDFLWTLMQCSIQDKETKAEVKLEKTIKPIQIVVLKQFFDAIKRFWSIGRRLVIQLLKSRQWGGSTIISCINYLILNVNPGFNGTIISYEDDSAVHLYSMYDRLWRHDRARRPKKNPRNQRKIEYNDCEEGGELNVDSGYKAALGRSTTKDVLHISEIPFFRDAKTALGALMPAVPKKARRLCVLESTAQGREHFYDLWKKDDPYIVKIFVGWLDDPDCRVKISAEEREAIHNNLSDEEVVLLARGADYEQLAFRREILATECNGDEDYYKQEYPSTPEEAFMFTGRSFLEGALIGVLHDRMEAWRLELHPSGHKMQDLIRRYELVITKYPDNPTYYFGKLVPHRDGRLVVYRNPLRKHSYVVSADASEGIELVVLGKKDTDNTAISVWDYFGPNDRPEKVASCVGKFSPEEAAYIVEWLAIRYNSAYVIPESNTHGRTLINNLVGDDRSRVPGARLLGEKPDPLIWRKLGYPAGLVYHRTNYDAKGKAAGKILGFCTSSRTRTPLLDDFKADITLGVNVYDPPSLDEYVSFVIDANGRAAAQNGHHDDRVFADALALHAIRYIPPRVHSDENKPSRTASRQSDLEKLRKLKPGQSYRGYTLVG